MTIDGSKSYDPGGELITFHWTITQAPAGSTATIDTADPAPAFIPDVPGTYLLQLLVINEAGISSLPARMVVVAVDGNAAPNARGGRDRRARVGSPVELDASQSFDPEHVPLSFQWSLASVARGSKLTDADLMLRETPTPWFTPDMPGAYELLLRASDRDSIGEDRVRVMATPGDSALMADAGDGPQRLHASPLLLHGSTGVDRDGKASRLASSWTLVTRPDMSALTSMSIRGADTDTANVSPDVDGAYVFRFAVSDGEKSDADNILVRFSRGSAPDSVNTATGIVPSAVVATPVAKRGAINRSPAFKLRVKPGSLRIATGANGTYAVVLQARDARGHGGSVATLSVTGLPSGVTAVLGTSSLAIPDTTTLTVNVATNTLAGRYPLLVTASTVTNGVTTSRSASVVLQVTSRLGEPPPPKPSCAGGDLPSLAATIYVAPGGSDVSGCGQTAATACATLQQGIDNCVASGCGVLMRYGRYATSATIVLKDGVSVYGSCVFSGVPVTNPTAANYRTVIEANPAPGTPAISATSINSATTVKGVVVIGKDETAAGTASIAMAVSNSNGLVLSRSALAAGRGGDAAAAGTSSQGAPGGTGNGPLETTNGGAGGMACPSNPTGGPGNGGQGADQKAVSLSGCFVLCVCNLTNFPNNLGRAGASSGVVPGGGGAGSSDDGCGCNENSGVPDGKAGNPGNPGACAAQGGVASSDRFGRFNGLTWISGTGGTGGNGSVGSGGGGGGSGGMSALADVGSAEGWAGLPGGGGGGGGCGGPGGTGGQQGGASIALVLVNSTIAGVGSQNSVIPGPGGAGGSGGRGGAGGLGGAGAGGWGGHYQHINAAGVCSADVPGSGGSGGQGGQGGAGGGGAGGNGGPSIGVAVVAGSPNPGSTGIYAGLDSVPGSKGFGGQNASQPGTQPNPCTAVAGATGVPGGSAPVVTFGTLTAGQQLTPGQELVSTNGSTLLALQTDSNFCLYVQGQFAWCAFTQGRDVERAIMQSDGNLCLFTAGGSNAVWCSNTGGHPGAYLNVQDNGQAVIYDGSTPLWTVP